MTPRRKKILVTVIALLSFPVAAIGAVAPPGAGSAEVGALPALAASSDATGAPAGVGAALPAAAANSSATHSTGHGPSGCSRRGRAPPSDRCR